MRTIGLIINTGKPRAQQVLQKLEVLAAAAGLELLCEESVKDLARGATPLPLPEMLDRMDALMAVGGDGTMLRAARLLSGRDKPIVGVNMGSLGFLTSVTEQDMERAVRCLATDDFRTSERTVIECHTRRGPAAGPPYHALNEIALRSGSARVVTLELRVNDEAVCSYLCDGLIVSTPTGSTGHSLSANGPIMHPETRAFIISPVCPHTLSSRPLVISDENSITVVIRDFSGELTLTADGQVGQLLHKGDHVHVARSSRNIRFIHLRDYSYFSVLRQKLGWRGSQV